MRTLKAILISLIFLGATALARNPQQTATIVTQISRAAAANGIGANLLIAICKVESGLRYKAMNDDDGGEDSIGLCQIKLSTARLHGYRGSALGLLRPEVNAFWAARHLRYLLTRYDGNAEYAIAAYNLGHLRLNKKGQIWNRSYVKKVRRALASLEEE